MHAHVFLMPLGRRLSGAGETPNGMLFVYGGVDKFTMDCLGNGHRLFTQTDIDIALAEALVLIRLDRFSILHAFLSLF